MPDPRHKPKSPLRLVVLALAGWLALAYVLAPLAWTVYDERRPPSALRTRTGAGIPGDPINIALIGTGPDVARAMSRAGWFPADPITPRTAFGIAASVLLGRPYDTAPVSTLYYLGHKQDLAFEKPIGDDADRRHHVRLWQVIAGVWFGAATEDVAVGLNHLTGQVTHHIGPEIDAERDALVDDLRATGLVGPELLQPGIGPVEFGRNGEFDRFHTDGLIAVARLVPKGG